MATTTSAGPTALLDRSSSNPKSSYIQWTKPWRQDSRIELVKRLETDEVSIVDFQSTDRAQVEGVTRDQLHVHAVGYEELTQTSAGLIELRGRFAQRDVLRGLRCAFAVWRGARIAVKTCT